MFCKHAIRFRRIIFNYFLIGYLNYNGYNNSVVDRNTVLSAAFFVLYLLIKKTKLN